MSELEKFESNFLDLIGDLDENGVKNELVDLGDGGDSVPDIQLQDAEAG